VEYSPAKVIDSFTISILMAVLLKVCSPHHGREVVGLEVGQVQGSSAYDRRSSRAGPSLLVEVLDPRAEDLIFGDHVELGGFVDVMLLAATLLAIRSHPTHLRAAGPVTDRR
jgi:hypothetical protein